MKNYYCKQCLKEFTTKFSMERHYKTVHEGTKEFKCECSKRFATKDQQKRHWLTKHAHALPYKCTDECGKAFHSKSALNSHQKNHHQWREIPQTFMAQSKRTYDYKFMKDMVLDYSFLDATTLNSLSKEIEELNEFKKEVELNPHGGENWTNYFF